MPSALPEPTLFATQPPRASHHTPQSTGPPPPRVAFHTLKTERASTFLGNGTLCLRKPRSPTFLWTRSSHALCRSCASNLLCPVTTKLHSLLALSRQIWGKMTSPLIKLWSFYTPPSTLSGRIFTRVPLISTLS